MTARRAVSFHRALTAINTPRWARPSMVSKRLADDAAESDTRNIRAAGRRAFVERCSLADCEPCHRIHPEGGSHAHPVQTVDMDS